MSSGQGPGNGILKRLAQKAVLLHLGAGTVVMVSLPCTMSAFDVGSATYRVPTLHHMVNNVFIARRTRSRSVMTLLTSGCSHALVVCVSSEELASQRPTQVRGDNHPPKSTLAMAVTKHSVERPRWTYSGAQGAMIKPAACTCGG